MKELLKAESDLYLESTERHIALRRAMLSKHIQSKEDRNKILEMRIKADPRISYYKIFRQLSAFSEAEELNLSEKLHLFKKHKTMWEELCNE